MLSRTRFVAGAAALLTLAAEPLTARARRNPVADLARLEATTGGRLGIFAVDTGGGATVSYRASERFPMCSTFKVLAAAAVLAKVDRKEESLNRRITYSAADILPYAPITAQNVKDGMTIEALCGAAIEYSDNTAANLLLQILGGPAAVTTYARAIGDSVTRLDRTEPELNSALPGDPRDTTTPAAMAADVQELVLGNSLTTRSRALLTVLLVNSRTGFSCLRAGLPRSWKVGDKTGSGGRNNAKGDSDTRNDIAVAWPNGGMPLVIAAYLTDSKVAAAQRDAAIAGAGRIVAACLR